MKIKLLLLLLVVLAAQAQTPTVSSVVNGISFTPGVSPGVLAAVSGTNFGTDAKAISVTVGGKAAYLLAVTNAQINLQIPAELQPGATTLSVTKTGAPAVPFNLTLNAYAPAIITRNGAALINPADFTPLTQVKPGDIVITYATGLGATNPAVATGTPAPTAGAPCVTNPQVTVSGIAAQLLGCGAAPGLIAAYQLNFKIATNVPPGSQPLMLSIGGFNSAAVNVTVAAGAPVISSVVNGASGAQNAPIAPGSLVTINGFGFGAKDVVTGFPGTTLAGVSVTMNGLPAPMLSVLASAATAQINVIAPNELPAQGSIMVVVKTADGSSAPLQVNMAAASPGIFRSNYKNYGAVALVNPNWPAPDPAMALGVTVNCATGGILAAANCGRAFLPGDAIQIYATGLGLATPGADPSAAPLATGQLAPADGSVMYQTVTPPTVTVGGVPAQVSWSGLASGVAGEYQVNITIPAGVAPGDDVPLVLSAGPLSDSVSIAIGGQ